MITFIEIAKGGNPRSARRRVRLREVVRGEAPRGKAERFRESGSQDQLLIVGPGRFECCPNVGGRGLHLPRGPQRGDDYLCKPLRQAELQAALERWQTAVQERH
jgi:hypothetical protein